MTDEEITRYSRHILLPEVGPAGQQKLLDSKVLLVGAGGLGCPAALYLAAAGVGTIGIVDHDRVSLSNLQRQILYALDEVDLPKTEVAFSRLKRLNPDVQVVKHSFALSVQNVTNTFQDYEYIIDGTDNFPTRYLVNDACILLGKKNIYGSIYRWEGQTTIFGAKGGPCYRCLFPEPPSPDTIPNCAEGGVLGVLPGIIGLVQAIETIKLILGKGNSLVGRLLVFDALSMKWNELKAFKDPECPICGENPTITELSESNQGCHAGDTERITMKESDKDFAKEVIPMNLMEIKKNSNDFLLLDVREPVEYEIARIEGAKLIPLGELQQRIDELEDYRNGTIVIYCHHGMRSLKAVDYLQSRGFPCLKSLKGGIDAWSSFVDSSVPRY